MLNEEIKVTENGGKTVTVLTLEDCEKSVSYTHLTLPTT